MKEKWLRCIKKAVRLDFLYSYHISYSTSLNANEVSRFSMLKLTKKNPQARCHQSYYWLC